MSFSRFPKELERQVDDELKRHADVCRRLASRYPEHRKGIVEGFFGGAVALVDWVEADAESALRAIRRMCTPPAPFRPPS